MTLDAIIKKYGAHDLDVSFCINDDELTTVLVYCHQHNVNGQFMTNHYLKITGKFSILRADVDELDVYIHIACIEKSQDGTYEMSGVGGYVQFLTDGDLLVEELTESDYNKLAR